jgi:hypothetical protein
MGRLVNGINGPFIGKLGTAVGSTYRGVPTLNQLIESGEGKLVRENRQTETNSVSRNPGWRLQ